MSETAPVIELVNVTKRFGNFAAVSNANLVITKGEVVGFVGANGAGKTTTISMLLGFIRASEGTIRLFGKDVLPSNAYRSHERIGYAAGDMELPATLTGKQYLNFLLHQAGMKDRTRLQELVERFSPQLDKKFKDLSRGNKQKVALIAAFATDPEVVILDEPSSGLDPAMQETFLELIKEVQARGTTVFMSSHYLQEVMSACSRVVLMKNGEIIEDVATKQLVAMGGKRITVKSGYRPTKPPKKAEAVETSFEDDLLTLSFVYKGEVAELQSWLAAVKQLKDIEVSEYDLEETFHSLYETEEAS